MESINTAKDWTENERREFLEQLGRDGKLSWDIGLYLVDKGILECPASSKPEYHGAYPGALFEHCLELYNFLSMLTDAMGIKWQRSQSIGNIAFGHDVCKLDSYTKIETADWEDLSNGEGVKISYKYNQESVLHGHGMKSVMLLQQKVHLTEEEMYCILYHMGAYEKDQWDAFDRAIKKYPTVLYTHTADMYASKIVGV